MDEMTMEVLTKVNEDYCGLYEIVWAFRTRFMSGAGEQELVAAAKNAVEWQLAQGNVRVIKLRMKPVPETREVPDSEISDILESADSWRTPGSWAEFYPGLDVTDKGRIAWLRPGSQGSGADDAGNVLQGQ